MNAGRRSRSRMPTPRSRTPTARIVGSRAPARYLTSVCGGGTRHAERRPRGRRFVKGLPAAYPFPPVASGEGTLGVDVGTGACTVCPSALFDVNDEREPMNRLGPLRV